MCRPKSIGQLFSEDREGITPQLQTQHPKRGPALLPSPAGQPHAGVELLHPGASKREALLQDSGSPLLLEAVAEAERKPGLSQGWKTHLYPCKKAGRLSQPSEGDPETGGEGKGCYHAQSQISGHSTADFPGG